MRLFGGARSGPDPDEPLVEPDVTAPGQDLPDTTALAALVDEAYDAVVVTTLDGAITYWNKSAYRLYGRGRGLELGGDLSTLVPEIVRPQIGRVLAAVAEGQLVPPFKRQHTYESGVVAVAEVAATPIRAPGGDVAGVGFFVRYTVQGMEPGDPLAVEAAEALYVGEFAPAAEEPKPRALLRSEARYRAIVETADQGIALIDSSGTFVFVNRRLTEFLGAPEEALVGEPATVLLGGDTGRLEQVQQSGAPQRYELFHSHPSGGTLCGLVTVTPIEDDNEFGPDTALVMVSDITHVKRVRDRNRSVVDELTDLANATLFYERVERAVRLAPDGSTAAVLVADVDRFRDANATLGHVVADELLRTVGERIASVCPAEATVARIVADQFAVFVEAVGDDDPEGLRPLAERIHEAVSQPVMFGTFELVPSVSIGIAMGLAGDPSPVGRVVATATTQHVADDVLRRAHAAMRSAREGGPGRTAVDEVRPLDTTAARMALVPELQRAIRGDQLTVSYLPVVDLATNAPIAVEALVRWPHPGRGLLEPSAFLSVAEESGLIAELGRWVLERAGQDAVAWHEAGAVLPLSVNVSARELSDSRFTTEIGQLLERTGLPSSALTLEIPELVFTDADGPMLERVRALRELGCRIAMDDFGSGYSSLSELGGLPLDVIKLDRAFVRNVADSDRAAALVRSVVEVARVFGLQVVAEGVETEGQRRALAELGCLAGEGFLWTTPLTRDELLVWLDPTTD